MYQSGNALLCTVLLSMLDT